MRISPLVDLQNCWAVVIGHWPAERFDHWAARLERSAHSEAQLARFGRSEVL